MVVALGGLRSNTRNARLEDIYGADKPGNVDFRSFCCTQERHNAIAPRPPTPDESRLRLRVTRNVRLDAISTLPVATATKTFHNVIMKTPL